MTPKAAVFPYAGTYRSLAIVLILAGLALYSSGGVDAQTASSHTDLPRTSPLTLQHDSALQARLQNALKEKGKTYSPRTRHFDPAGAPLYTNRLILEDSPYLIQHAHNPVDWYPWGKEAFARAKEENKPVFLSIGYSTCHWCHVMERESFENEQIAQLLNIYFIPIKVDRERRPGIDASYMSAVQILTGHGGWPLSSFLTPDGKTFFGGTYFPPDQFARILREIDTAWHTQLPSIIAQGERVASAVARISATREKAKKLAPTAITDAVRTIMSSYDELQGGFGEAPKFPDEPLLFLLLNHVGRTDDQTVMDALEHTLDAMARGGIYDQIGGGFHRYATDFAWQVPHFEKMLYNQAHLSHIYLHAWRLTGNPEFERIARHTLDYVLREMTAREGGFYSATDADSEGEEGLYFLWTPQQLRSALNKDDAHLASNIYGVSEAGNFEGRNILHLSQPLADDAARYGLAPEQLRKRLDQINLRLLNARHKRIPPLLDDKIITAWNGMMITTLALAGDLLDESRYLNAATRAGEFIWKHNRDKGGELLRIYLNGRATVDASQEDYAYLANGFLMLFDVTGKPHWLKRAREITDRMLARFRDTKNGGFYLSGKESITPGLGRARDIHDGAIPSGNSLALHVLQKLSRRTDNLEYHNIAQETLSALAARVERNPQAFAYLLSAADDLLNGETGARQFAAQGAITVHAALHGERLILNLSLKPGWHINAHKPLQEYLIPTTLRPHNAGAWRLAAVEYPHAKVATLGFQKEPLALYEGEIKLTAALIKHDKAWPAGKVPKIELRLQACNDKVCLPPESIQMRPVQRQPLPSTG